MPTNVLLRAWFLQRAGRFRLAQPRPEGDAEVVVRGADPIRVLVTGAGFAAGYGVRTHAEGLAGALADRLAEATGRGVEVTVHARPTLAARRAIAHLEPERLRGHPFVVFAPCFLESAFVPGLSLRRCAAAIQQHLLDAGGGGTEVAVLGMPRPAHFSRLNLVAARTADRLNAVLRAVAERAPRAQFVEAPAFPGVRDPHPFDADYYAELGDAIAQRFLGRAGTDPLAAAGR